MFMCLYDYMQATFPAPPRGMSTYNAGEKYNNINCID